MLIIRGTKKLRDRVKAPLAGEDDVSTNALGDWFANLLFWDRQVALLVNRRTLVPVFMPMAPAATLPKRAPRAIADVLIRLGVDRAVVEAELTEMAEVRLAPTDDRRVVGVMNELAFHGEILRAQGEQTLEDISARVADVILGPLMQTTLTPASELAAVLATDLTPRATAGSVYQMKVTLMGTKPPIWRRLLVAGSSTLDDVHTAIQAAFGWWNYHLHEFEIDGVRYTIPDPDWDHGPPVRDDRKVRLDAVAVEGSSFPYTYDFGDNWEHRIEIERVFDESPVASLPACTGGRRAAPPEDCGGVWGYERLLGILADPSHPEHADLAAWAGPWREANPDPAVFDPEQFDANLSFLRNASIEYY